MELLSGAPGPGRLPGSEDMLRGYSVSLSPAEARCSHLRHSCEGESCNVIFDKVCLCVTVDHMRNIKLGHIRKNNRSIRGWLFIPVGERLGREKT